MKFLLRYRTTAVFLTGLWLLPTLSVGQTRERESDAAAMKSATQPGVSSVLTIGPALDGPVKPETYVVGPSDVLALGIWTSPPITFNLTVTPEGSVVIPTVGEVHVADVTLREAKSRILAEVRKRYLTGDPTVTLVMPRRVVVTVMGNVRNPGRYTMNATDRIDRVIDQANLRIPEQNLAEERRFPPGKLESQRNIILRRRQGEMVRIDLLKFFATQEERWNPLLRDGDEVFVPVADRTKGVIAVYGGVNNPGRFEFSPGDSVLGAIQLAYGLNSRAIRDSVLLVRYLPETQQSVTILNLDAMMSGKAPDVLLYPGDRIIVRQQPERREDYRVMVEGEVVYPGTYPITRSGTRLSTVIRMAGGFTEYAALNSAEVIRSSVQPDEIEFERLLSLRGSVTPEDSSYYVLESELRLRREIVNVDFGRLFVEGDTSQDVVLRSEDRIVVPSVRRTIYVFGQVVSPGNVPYVPGRDANYYIMKAGGLTEKARDADVMIIKRSTRQWLAPKETTIEEGDYVWVPKVPERPFSYYMRILGETASVVSVAVSIVLLAIQLRK